MDGSDFNRDFENGDFREKMSIRVSIKTPLDNPLEIVYLPIIPRPMKFSHRGRGIAVMTVIRRVRTESWRRTASLI